MKNYELIDEIRDSVADYLTARKCYESFADAIEAVINYPDEVMDYLAELDMFGDRYANGIALAFTETF